ncbi:hypothetical protein TcasGA2_TC012472 [Tribolium castaneum]|uniref:Uncharacterized protein n=1 Tax=Tribolium castaneum TaxID=7070 RepID=D6X2H1_TRICA|nr:hypothetical protein TcasGA2_TC012472 [Tribolium castaneum]
MRTLQQITIINRESSVHSMWAPIKIFINMRFRGCTVEMSQVRAYNKLHSERTKNLLHSLANEPLQQEINILAKCPDFSRYKKALPVATCRNFSMHEKKTDSCLNHRLKICNYSSYTL